MVHTTFLCLQHCFEYVLLLLDVGMLLCVSALIATLALLAIDAKPLAHAIFRALMRRL